MEESVSGFKTRGGWVKIVEHGERITHALQQYAEECSLDEDALTEFDDWRPKSHERLDEDVNEKTAQQAHLSEGKGEQAGKDPDEDLQTAGQKLAESYESLNDPDEAVSKWGESIDYVARAADSAGRRAIRRVEDTVYQSVMTRVSPYYFDNELISANIQGVARGDRPEYVFEVNINDDSIKQRVSDRLADYETDVERWHVNTQKETEYRRARRGVAVADGDDGVDADTT